MIIWTDSGPGNLVSKLQTWGMVPTTQQTFDENDLIQMLDDEFVSTIVPLIKSAMEEYFVFNTFITLPTPVATGNNYNVYIDIPTDAIGLDLRDVWIVDQANNVIKCRRYNPDNISYNTMLDWWNTFQGPAYFIENNRIVFFNYNNQVNYQQAQLRYFKKPSHLISSAQAGLVTAVNTGSNTITVNNISGIGTGVFSNTYWYNGCLADFLFPKVPYQFDNAQVVCSNVVITGNNMVLTVSSNDIANITVGDICTPSGMAPVVQFVPEEANNVIIQSALLRLLSSQSDDTAFQRESTKYNQYAKNLLDMITPKVQSEVKKIMTWNNIYNVNRASSNPLFRG